MRHRVWWWSWADTERHHYWWLTSQLLDVDGPFPRPMGPPELPAGGPAASGRIGRRGLQLVVQRLSRAVGDPALAVHGLLTRAADEEQLMQDLGDQLIPDIIRSALLDRRSSESHTVVVSASPALGAVPWDVLAVHPQVRLLELARVRGALSPALLEGVTRTPPKETGPAVLVVDASPAARRIYGDRGTGHGGRWSDPGVGGIDPVRTGTIDGLRSALQRHPRRLLVFGHMGMPGTGDPDQAFLQLTDGTLTSHRILTDPDHWTMPERVAFIGCHSDDADQPERLGLVVSAFRAGASLVTTTRWALPTDARLGPQGSTTRLGLAVDAAHDEKDPVGALRSWQLRQLDTWRAAPSAESSPLVWGSLATYVAPPRWTGAVAGS